MRSPMRRVHGERQRRRRWESTRASALERQLQQQLQRMAMPVKLTRSCLTLPLLLKLGAWAAVGVRVVAATVVSLRWVVPLLLPPAPPLPEWMVMTLRRCEPRGPPCCHPPSARAACIAP